MSSDRNMREQIFEIVRKIIRKRLKDDRFVPGKSYINYAGRVYDEKEVIGLVDSSIDFWLTAGNYAREFEEKLAAFLSVRYAVLTNSGSSANLLALTALTSPLLKDRRLKPGDEVITTACGFPTTLNPIIQNNAVPVFVDVELGNYTIDPVKLKKAISNNTKAVMVAHTLGNPVNIDAIRKLCKEHGLWFIEDNCDALGSKYRGRFTGTYGDIATCSFYPAHHITMGEGGALLTNDPLLRQIILSFRDWGRDCWCEPGHDNTCQNRFNGRFGDLPFGYDHKYVYSHIGYNLKVTDMQAAIGCAQMEKLPRFIRARKENYAGLMKILKKYGKFLLLPEPSAYADPSWFGFPILVKESAPFERADIVTHLEKNKIATRMLFGGNMIKQPAYLGIHCRIVGGLTNTDLVMKNLFWIGVYPGITRDKLKYIKGTIDSFMKKYR